LAIFSICAHLWGLTPAVSCAAGRRVQGGGRQAEAGARQCACGRPLKREESSVATVV